MSWGFPIIHCPHCHHVGKPTLTAGTSTHTWTATCTACLVVIKQLPRLGETVRPEAYRRGEGHAQS